MDDPTGRRALSGSPIPDGLDASLVFVRHGESQFIVEGRFQGQADSPLSTAGREQAALVADRLARQHESPALPIPDGPLREIVHSPLGRTTETASAIASARSQAGTDDGAADPPVVRADPGFAEIGQGVWEGLHRDQITTRYAAELAAWRHAPAESWAPGGESLQMVAQRVRSALSTALGNLAGSDVGPNDDLVAGYRVAARRDPWSLIVGHDGVFKVTMLTLFDLPLERFWMWSFELCAITVVDIRGGRPILRAHNLSGHLAPRLDGTAIAERAAREASGAL